MTTVAGELFQSEARTGLLRLLAGGLRASVSELSRRLRLTPRAVGVEVDRLRRVGLVLVESVGGADLVTFNANHRAAKALRTLLDTPATPPVNTEEDDRVRASLAAYGAPLAVAEATAHYPLDETFVRAVELARRDGTVLRVLPTFVAAQRGALDWRAVTEEARRRKLKSEVGFVVELTSKLQNWQMPSEVEGLHDARHTKRRFFPEVKSRFEKPLAEQRSPAVAAKWGLWVNMSEDSFRSTLEKHVS